MSWVLAPTRAWLGIARAAHDMRPDGRGRRAARGSRACRPCGGALASRRGTVPRSSPMTSAPRARALEREDAEQVVGREAHVGSLGARPPRGDPELPKESHHVIDAERAGVAEGRAQKADPVAVAVAAKRVRVERRQAPVLAGGREPVGRRAEARAVEHEQSRETPTGRCRAPPTRARRPDRRRSRAAARAARAATAPSWRSSSNWTHIARSIASAWRARNADHGGGGRIAPRARPAPPIAPGRRREVRFERDVGREVDQRRAFGVAIAPVGAAAGVSPHRDAVRRRCDAARR